LRVVPTAMTRCAIFRMRNWIVLSGCHKKQMVEKRA